MKVIGITGSKGKTSVAYLTYEYIKYIGKTALLFSSLDYEIAIPTNNRLKEAIELGKQSNIEYLIIEINEEYINNLDKSLFDVKLLTNVSIINGKEGLNDYIDNIFSFFTNSSLNIITYSPIVEKGKFLTLINKLENKILIGSLFELNVKNIDVNLFDNIIQNNNLPIEVVNKSGEYEGIKFHIFNKIIGDLLIKSNLLFRYNACNINSLFTLINALSIYNEESFLKFVSNINIPGRSEVININNRKIIITISIIPILKQLYQFNKDINLIIGSIGIGHNTWEEKYNTKEQEIRLKKARSFACSYASKYSKTIYLTSSDPASSNPIDIANEMEQYLLENGFTNSIIITDRYEAIRNAIMNSTKGSVIVISGRGSREKYIKENKEYLFSDVKVVAEIIKDIGWE